MTECPPHLRGVLCDWPVCENGKVQPSTRECMCNDGWAPPHCTECISTRWGRDCDKEYSRPRTSLPAVPYLPEMSAMDTKTKGAISLKGSAQLVQEFFHYGLNSILYQRGIYPSDSFGRVKQYGLTLLTTNDNKLKAFLEPLFKQIEKFLATKNLKRLVMVISEIKTKEVVERWQFDIQTENLSEEGENSTRQKDEKKIRQEMGDVIRQITASVTFLPLLEVPCSFDVLIYTGKDTAMPQDWSESSACLIQNAEQVQLRSFSTSVHSVQAQVQYKME